MQAAMRIIAIVVVLLIAFLVYGRMGGTQDSLSRLAEREASAIQPSATLPAPVSPHTLRTPLDRTRQVLESVKPRNAE